MLMLVYKILVDWSLVKRVNGRVESSEKWKCCHQAFAEQQNKLKETSVKHLKHLEINFLCITVGQICGFKCFTVLKTDVQTFIFSDN